MEVKPIAIHFYMPDGVCPYCHMDNKHTPSYLRANSCPLTVTSYSKDSGRCPVLHQQRWEYLPWAWGHCLQTLGSWNTKY